MYKKSVCIVDDHKLLCQAIAGLINSFPDFEVVGTYNDGKEYIKALARNNFIPDITLMDVKMPVLNGIETTQILTKKYPKIKVIALSVEDDERSIIRMLKAGAKGYLLKDIEKQELRTALHCVCANNFYHSTTIDNALNNSSKISIDKPILKDREIDFLKYACSELTYKEIADRMNLSPKTIDGYRNSLFKKLKIKSRVGLTMFAIKEGIVKID